MKKLFLKGLFIGFLFLLLPKIGWSQAEIGCTTGIFVLKSYGNVNVDDGYNCLKQKDATFWAVGSTVRTINGVSTRGLLLSHLDESGVLLAPGHIFIPPIGTKPILPMDLAFDNAGNIVIVGFYLTGTGTTNDEEGLIFSINPTTATINWTRRYTYGVSGTGQVFAPYAIKSVNYYLSPLPLGGVSTTAYFVVSGEYRYNNSNNSLAGILVLDPVTGAKQNISSVGYEYGTSAETYKDFALSTNKPLMSYPNMNTQPLYTVGRLTVNGNNINMRPMYHKINIAGTLTSTSPQSLYTSATTTTTRRYNECIIKESTRSVICGFGSATGTSLSGSSSNFYVYAVDANGTTLWVKEYNLSLSNPPSVLSNYNGLYAGSMVSVSNGYVILGRSYNSVSGAEYNSFLLNIDANGNPLTAFQYPLKTAYHKALQSDGGTNVYFVGAIKENTSTSSNAAFIKADNTGQSTMASACGTPITFVATTQVPATYSYTFTYPSTTETITTINPAPVSITVTKNCYCNSIISSSPSDRFSHSGQENKLETTLFSLTPNPATDYLQIQIPAVLGMHTLKVCNLNGQTVLERGVDADKFNLDISTLPSAVYILKLEGTGEPQVQKFIKN